MANRPHRPLGPRTLRIRDRGLHWFAMAVYADLVRYRELFANLFRRDFQAKYRGSVLGLVWSLVNPLALIVVYLVVFGVHLDQANGIPHYPLYLLAGLACWIFFAMSLQTGGALAGRERRPRAEGALPAAARRRSRSSRRSSSPSRRCSAILIVLSLVFVPDARPTSGSSIPLSLLFLCLVAGAGAHRRVAERRPPRRRAHPRRRAPAVVLPHADPLELRRAAGRAPGPPDAARRAPLGQLHLPADHGRARHALARRSARRRRRDLPRRRGGGRARARLVRLPPRRRPASRSSSERVRPPAPVPVWCPCSCSCPTWRRPRR